MEENYIQPDFNKKNFHCPHCGVLSFQNWNSVYDNNSGMATQFYDVRIALCQNCDEKTIWKDGNMIYPRILTATTAHKDMPESVKVLYNEARNISIDSPRAAAALLRVSLEKLTEELGEVKGKLNTRISNLKSKGLPEKVIQSLDVVRIFANEGGSHAGQIDLSG